MIREEKLTFLMRIVFERFGNIECNEWIELWN